MQPSRVHSVLNKEKETPREQGLIAGARYGPITDPAVAVESTLESKQ
jgi:hypothetical protein